MQYSTSNDKLQVLLSTNCGVSWSTVYNKGGAALATAPASNASFVPTNSQWRTETVALTPYASAEDVLIKFKAISNNGNNIWLDHIVVANGTGIENNDLAGEISIYPNPAIDKVYIKSDVTINQIDIVSIQGQVISSEQVINNEINVNTLATGVYMLRIYTEQGIAIKKFVKE
ncbi:MAG: T9SS type A sorting domain-containing protein [Bacteroidales bacterium]